jgi:hypothetical protein
MWRGHNEEAKRGPPWGLRITRHGEAMGSLLLTCAATGLSRIAGWCVLGATLWGQPWTPVVTVSLVRDGLRELWMAVLCPFRRLFRCRPVPRPCMRNALLDRYKDAAGYDTIGFEHLIKPGEQIKEPLLGDAAERLLLQDVKPKAAAVNARVSVPLSQGQFDAAVSWTYNLGEGALKSSTTLKKINAGQHE